MTAAKHTQGTLGARIVRASFIVGIAHLLLKLAGLLQAKVLAQYLDQGQYDIIYAFVFENCIFAVFLIGEEVIGPTFLPVFMREMDERGEDSAWRFGSAVLSLQFLILLVTVGAMVLFPGVVIRLIT
ncbi:MAG: hypothetical protein K9N51_10050, partial [Candidatus Pacebacteria bacterium]|nr:hypothetical protein [Candidatus Paceibacterota bacterium]